MKHRGEEATTNTQNREEGRTWLHPDGTHRCQGKGSKKLAKTEAAQSEPRGSYTKGADVSKRPKLKTRKKGRAKGWQEAARGREHSERYPTSPTWQSGHGSQSEAPLSTLDGNTGSVRGCGWRHGFISGPCEAWSGAAFRVHVLAIGPNTLRPSDPPIWELGPQSTGRLHPATGAM